MKTYLTAFAMIVLAGLLVYVAEAQTATCQATGNTLSVAIQNFNAECDTVYNKDLGHDCDPVSAGWLCTGEFADPDPEPEPDPDVTMVPTCKETGSTLTIAESRYDEACQPYRECALNSATGKFECEGYTIQNAIAPEPDPEPELPVCTGKPTLTNPLVVNLLPSGNPDLINAGGRDVQLVWPAVPVTDDGIEIRGARHIHSIAGHFQPTGNSDLNSALKFMSQVTGGVTYVERMLIDNTARRYQDAYMLSDPDTIQSVHNTGDAIMFGGQVPYSASLQTTYPSFVMVKSVIKGVSGQHPEGCTTCGGAHADAFETVGPSDTVTFKDVHVSSNYQGIFAAPAKNFYGEYLEPNEQNLNGVNFDNVTATVVEPPNLSASDQTKWRYRATGYYLEAYNLRSIGKQSFWDIDIDGGGLWLDTPTTETQHWLNFIGGKLVLHDEISPGVASLDYVPGAVLRHGVSPDAPTEAEVGPGSEPICQ